jgi:hypothetical protein
MIASRVLREGNAGVLCNADRVAERCMPAAPRAVGTRCLGVCGLVRKGVAVPMSWIKTCTSFLPSFLPSFLSSVAREHDESSSNPGGLMARNNLIEMERRQLAIETLELSLADGKTILHGVQDFVASHQTAEDLERRRNCPSCGQRYHSKGIGTHTVQRCTGQFRFRIHGGSGVRASPQCPKTFRSSAAWLQGRTSPELLYWKAGSRGGPADGSGSHSGAFRARGETLG